MRCVHVKTDSASYDVKIGAGLLDTIGRELRACTDAKTVVVVSGENVFPIYGDRVLNGLRSAGFRAEAKVFPSGEETKSLASYGELLNLLTECRLTRSDCLVALGGGVTGDLTGFAAATYQRGIRYVQVPTTLLAAVDSSVGGKTAVNLPVAKNQVGAFHQPSLVLCDTGTLDTLPERELNAGFAEVIKDRVIADPDLFDLLQQGNFDRESIIEACVNMKADIVAEDEHDFGRRRLLNLGHTFGHAIEARSGYELLHGEAVAIGTAMIVRAAVRMGILDTGSRDAVIELLKQFRLPVEPPYSADELFDILLLDKKIASGRLHLIVPRSVGWCEAIPVDREALRRWLEAAYE